MSEEEFLIKIHDLYVKYNPPTMRGSEYPYLESELLELFLDFKEVEHNGA